MRNPGRSSGARAAIALAALVYSGLAAAAASSAPLPTPSATVDEARLAQAAAAPTWLKLLHYHRFFPWNSERGEVDGDGFYLSPNGREDPRAELDATLAAFESRAIVGKLRQPAACAFPERFRYIERALGTRLPAARPGDCAYYEKYVGKLNPQGVSLVFSSAFASNPGSMFGHTFLKIATGRKSDLLDQGISFAATVPPGEGGLFFVVYGLLGGYAGDYSFLSYHEKVQEYVNTESRDLWEYKLAFTPEESRRLVDHLWELESNSWFDYYFINKNCSYQLLAAMEVVKPDWDLTSGWLWVVPAETVKRVIKVAGAVNEIRYRPSLRKKMVQSLDALSAAERARFADLITQRIAPRDVSSPAVLSTAIEYIQYHRAESVGVDRQDLLALWDATLERRAELAEATDRAPAVIAATPSAVAPPERDGDSVHTTAAAPRDGATVSRAYAEPPADRPEMGHGPIRIGLGQGLAARGDGPGFGFQELQIKPAYHDLLNSDRGYPVFSEIDFPNLSLRYYPQTHALTLDRLQLVGMVSIFPLDFLEKRWSWKVDAEIEAPKDLACDGCHVFHGEMGWGASLRLGTPRVVAYTMGGAYFDLGSGLERPYRLGPSVDAGLLANPWQPYKLRLRGLVYGDALQPFRPALFGAAGLDQSLALNAHWETRLEAQRYFSTVDYAEARLSLQYYF